MPLGAITLEPLEQYSIDQKRDLGVQAVNQVVAKVDRYHQSADKYKKLLAVLGLSETALLKYSGRQ